MKQTLLPSPQTALPPESTELRPRRGRSTESWAARWRNAFGRSTEGPLTAAASEEAEVWMEYHNPMLGLSEELEPAD